MGDTCVFAARCSVIGATVDIETAWDRRSLGDWSEHTYKTDLPRGLAAAVVPATTIAAGIVVGEFVRYSAGLRPNRRICIDIRSLDVIVENPA